MQTHIGTLKIISALLHPELLAQSVADALVLLSDKEDVGVVEIDPELSDTRAFCEHYQFPLEQSGNCVVLEAKRGEKHWFAACVILANTRADINGVVRRTLDARRVSFAQMEEAVAQTGMEYGAITPIGLPHDWSLLIDEAVVDCPQVVIGSGIRKSKLVVSGALLASLSNAQVLEGLGQVKMT